MVFVVENEGIIAQTLAIMLNQAGFQASAFDHPEKAIAASTQLTPALLISDVMMPGMTGVELAIHFRRSHPDCKVPLFSGQAATADLLKRLAQRVTTSIYSRNLSILRKSSGKAPSLSVRNQIFALAGRLSGATTHEVKNRLAPPADLIFLVRILSVDSPF